MKSRILLTAALCVALVACGRNSANAKPVGGQEAASVEAASQDNAPITVLEDNTGADGVRKICAKPYGICPRQINVSVKNSVIVKVEFIGGCPGNTQAVSKLVTGMKVGDAIEKLEGIDCGGKGTSCPDRLSAVLKLFLK